MSQQALYRRWRSQTLDEIVGQPHVVQTLSNAIDQGRVAHAYIFSGPRGTGKTSTARILAKVVNCLAPEGERPCNECALCVSIGDGSSLDLIEIDAASNTQVDKVRDVIVEKINFAPSEARKKVYIIDEVHMLSNSAFNALLKTIEEPPPHVMFVLATTEIHKIPATILSRCQRLDFRRIGVSEIAEHLAVVLGEEGVSTEPDVLELVARQATGSMRDALSLLDQLLAHGGSELTLEQARAALGLATTEAVQALLDALLDRELATALDMVNQLIDQGTDPRQFLADVLDHLRALLLLIAGGDTRLLNLPDETILRLRAQAARVEPATLVEIIRLFGQASADLRQGLQPQLPLELAIVESVLALQRRGGGPLPSAAAPTTDDPPESRAPRPDESAEARQSRDASPPPSAPAPPPPPDEPVQKVAELSEIAPSAVEETTGRGLEWWVARWPDFIEHLTAQDEHGKRAALRLKFCEPVEQVADRLTLGFAYSIHLQKIDGPAERAAVERALSAFADGPIRLETRLVPRNADASESKTRFEAAADDPVVQEALRLGGQIVDVQLPDQP